MAREHRYCGERFPRAFHSSPGVSSLGDTSHRVPTLSGGHWAAAEPTTARTCAQLLSCGRLRRGKVPISGGSVHVRRPAVLLSPGNTHSCAVCTCGKSSKPAGGQSHVVHRVL